MRILITGACGMIARALVKELESRHELRLLDRIDPSEATVFVPGSAERARAPYKPDWPFIKADILDDQAILAAFKQAQPDAVVHLAAGVTGLPEVGVETFKINSVGTYIMLDACRLTGVRRFTCASSVNAFGTIYWRLSGKPPVYTSMPLDESFPPVPEDAYSLSKYVNEETCAAFHRAYNITTAAFRFAGVWTVEMYEKTVAQPLKPTTQWNDDLFQWVHLYDIAAGIRQALETPDLPGHGAYYLGAADTRCPEPTLEILNRFRPDLAANVMQPLPGRASLISIKRAQQAFGYAPKYALV
ncbi:MAG: NAD(P)-dependent oxidoreductase [Chloroflexi bacterium]|nr:NAD(P)-dependent oxidoreductase [Chloroflexota bacterium]MCL5273347.1 NAD(P)-dependent oxidoreductase [Chloroflexota bacterium]